MSNETIWERNLVHDVISQRPDGVDTLYIRTFCSRYIREPAFSKAIQPGVPTCFGCIMGRALYEHVMEMADDIGGEPMQRRLAEKIDEGAVRL